MRPIFDCHISVLLFIYIIIKGCQAGTNLSCYQCTRNTNEECPKEDLKLCPEISDRCVTHISKNPEQGMILKRECGLGPCNFDDPDMNKGLGLYECDRSREDYFCLFCCKESGCNKSRATNLFLSKFTLFCAFVLGVFIKQ